MLLIIHFLIHAWLVEQTVKLFCCYDVCGGRLKNVTAGPMMNQGLVPLSDICGMLQVVAERIRPFSMQFNRFLECCPMQRHETHELPDLMIVHPSSKKGFLEATQHELSSEQA